MQDRKRWAGVVAVVAVLAMGAGPGAAAEQEAVFPASSAGINTAENARTVADAWLKFARVQGVKLGSVHEVRLIYVVDLVKADDPKVLVNQLIIRAGDGYTQLVY